MEIIHLDQMEVLAGLEWSALPSDVPEKKALSEVLAEDKKQKKGVIIRSDGITVVGRPSSFQKKIPNLPSALGLLALANQKAIEDMGGLSSGVTASDEHNWIVVEQVRGDDDKYWLGAVKNGVPVPGGDIVGPRHKIIDHLVDFVNASSSFTVFTSDKEVRYNVVSQVNVVERSYSDLVRGVSSKGAYLKLFSIGAIVAICVIVFGLLLVGGWYGYGEWSAKQKLEAQRRIAAQQQQMQSQQTEKEKADYEKNVRDIVLKSLKEGMDGVSASISSPSPYASMDAWRSILYGIDIYQSGWDMEKIDCVMETEASPACTVFLKRGLLGVNKNLINDVADATIEGDSASYTIRIPNIKQRDAQFSLITPSKNFSMGLLSDLQSIRSTGIEHTITPSKEMVKDVTLPPVPSLVPTDPNAPADVSNKVSISLGFATGSITIKGNELWQMAGAAKFLDHPNIIVKDLSVAQKSNSLGQSSWTLMLDYIIRTLPEPVIPAIPLGEVKIVVAVPDEYKGNVVSKGGIDTGSSVSSTATSGDPLSDSLFESDNLAPPEPR